MQTHDFKELTSLGKSYTCDYRGGKTSSGLEGARDLGGHLCQRQKYCVQVTT